MSKSTIAFKKSEEQRHIEYKIKVIERHSNSEALFDELIESIETLRNDESSDDFTVRDDYNFGVEHDIQILLELISDLRWYTRLVKDEDYDTINKFNLNYLRPYLD